MANFLLTMAMGWLVVIFSAASNDCFNPTSSCYVMTLKKCYALSETAQNIISLNFQMAL